jgi:hypothetical protein
MQQSATWRLRTNASDYGRFSPVAEIVFFEASIASGFAAGHNLAVPSEPVVAMRFPSGENATEVTGPPS